jgi:hypothetical protein
MKESKQLPIRLLFLALVGGGLIGGVTNFFLLPSVWPWLMPPLVHRFLAAAALAIFLSSLVCWLHQRWAETQFVLINVLIYAFPLLLAVAIDFSLIDMRNPLTWLFFLLVTTAVLICIYYLWQKRNTQSDAKNLTDGTRTFLLSLGVLSGMVGLLVFVVPKQAGFLWPWAVLAAWKPLDSRLIASMLLMIAGGALWTRWRNDRGVWGLTAVILWTYCVIVSISLMLHAAATPDFLVPDLTYIVIFAILTLTSVYFYRQEIAN